MRVNTRTAGPRTHEGAAASVIKPLEQLKRTVLACMLFEDSFYEDGVSAAQRIVETAHKCKVAEVLELAKAARLAYGLRSAPVWLLNAVFNHPQRTPEDTPAIVEAIVKVCKRPDDMGELVAMYWKDCKRPLPAAMKKGLAKAFVQYSVYQLAKYAKRGVIRLRDVLRLVHPTPATDEQSRAWKALAADELAPADTWEVALSGGADKHATFTRLLEERKLGALALLRNLRNMADAGVDKQLVFNELARLAPGALLLPFQYMAAARAVPQWENALEAPMLASAGSFEPLPGRTALLVDKSGSMNATLSSRSTINRLDAAKALAILCREMCADVDVFAFATDVHAVPARRGFALADAIGHAAGGTYLQTALDKLKEPYERIIVITDEQSHQAVSPPPKGARGYVMNVAAYQHGISRGAWTTISGFSENVLQFIAANEQQ